LSISNMPFTLISWKTMLAFLASQRSYCRPRSAIQIFACVLSREYEISWFCLSSSMVKTVECVRPILVRVWKVPWRSMWSCSLFISSKSTEHTLFPWTAHRIFLTTSLIFPGPG
jgi:hypothetical protein